VAPQAPLVCGCGGRCGRRGGDSWGRSKLAGAARPGRGPRGGHVVGVDAQGRGDAIGDAQQLAMWLCNGNLGRRSRVGRVGLEGSGWPLPAAGARRRRRFCRRVGDGLDGAVVVGARKQRAAFRGPSCRDGRVVVVALGLWVGVIARHGQEVEPGLPFIRAPQQRRPNGVGHGSDQT